jgi:ABC-type multidrug transport system ATPase subunit
MRHESRSSAVWAAAHPPAVLNIVGLTKRYGDVIAVDDVSLDVNRAEIFGLLGQNGAGKTTTIEMLCGLLRPDAGSIELLGIDIVRRRRQAQRQVGYQPQDRDLYPPLTPRQNIEFAAGLHGISRRAARGRIHELLVRLDLLDIADRISAKLSGGEQRRVCLAMAMAHDPPLLVLDEPTSGVDVGTRLMLQRWFRELREAGKTIVYTTHYLEEAQLLCDRVAILHHGRVVSCDSVTSFLADYGTGLLTIHPSKDADKRLADLLTERLPVADVRLVDGALVVATSTPQRDLVPAIQALTDIGVVVAAVEVSPPTLEGAFLAATGERYAGKEAS